MKDALEQKGTGSDQHTINPHCSQSSGGGTVIYKHKYKCKNRNFYVHIPVDDALDYDTVNDTNL